MPARTAAAMSGSRASVKAARRVGNAARRKTSAVERRATPKTYFTVSIHGPLRGSESENAPMRKKSRPIPSA